MFTKYNNKSALCIVILQMEGVQEADVFHLSVWKFMCDGELPSTILTYADGSRHRLSYNTRLDPDSIYETVELEPQPHYGGEDKKYDTIVTYTQTARAACWGDCLDLSRILQSCPLLEMSDNCDVAAKLVLLKEDGEELVIFKNPDRSWRVQDCFDELSSIMGTIKRCLPLVRFKTAKIWYETAPPPDLQLKVKSFNVVTTTSPVIGVDINVAPPREKETVSIKIHHLRNYSPFEEREGVAGLAFQM